MTKALYIAEKPSVAQEFAKALHEDMSRGDGYLESEHSVVTWCVGHLVTMSYPEAYDPALKRWSLDTLPFLPEEFRYEVIAAVKKQFGIVKKQLSRSDVETIYVCTDSGREGEYIYRLVEQMAGVKGKIRKRVWIDSQTEEEILNGIRNAKDLSCYDDLAASAYLRAKEDYLMGINFSRVLTLKYSSRLASFLHEQHITVSVGRVMTCVLGMTVRREREIRSFVKTPFYRLLADLNLPGAPEKTVQAEWRVTPDSRYWGHPALYKENGFKDKETAEKAAAEWMRRKPAEAVIEKRETKKEIVKPPLLFNLAELQNVCSKTMKISPDETLKLVQELYEKKLVTYPRTDARVLSTAIAKEIVKNISGLGKIAQAAPFVKRILDEERYIGIEKTSYTNDKMITDHYAIIPTGQGLNNLASLNPKARNVYEKIVRRFLAIFYPPAEYKKLELEAVISGEHFFASMKALTEKGFMEVSGVYGARKKGEDAEAETEAGAEIIDAFSSLRKGSRTECREIRVKEGETTPPKRYTSGSMILAMENAGQLIEDEDLRAQIKGSGIGTSATRAEILKKLVTIKYLSLSSKTQVITPTLLGEMIFDTVACSMKQLLNPELTASWELGLTRVAEGTISPEEYMTKLEDFIRRRVRSSVEIDCGSYLDAAYRQTAVFYEKK